MWLLVISFATLPVVYGLLDRLRGTNGKLLGLSYSYLYAASVGLTFGLMFDWLVGILASFLFKLGEQKNWQEKGYYYQGSKNIHTIGELLFRGWLWWSPMFIPVWIMGYIDNSMFIATQVVPAIIFFSSVDLSAKIWNNYKDKIYVDSGWFHINHPWSLDEFMRSYLLMLFILGVYYG